MGLVDAISKDTTMELRVPEFTKLLVDAANCAAERRVLLNAMQNHIPYDYALIMAGYSMQSEESKEEEENL